MTTEEMLQAFIDEGVVSYKKNNKGNALYGYLSRHTPVNIDGYIIEYWYELGVLKTAQWLREFLPKADIYVTLWGNDSILKIAIDDEEQRKLNSKLFQIIKAYDIAV